MTLVHCEQQTIDLEQDEKVDTLVAGLRYTGSNSTATPNRPRRQGGWPGRASFQGGPVTERADDGTVLEREPGPIQIGVIPDRIDTDYVEGGTLPGLENLSDFEVVYDPAELAQAILDSNYLPSNVFGGVRTAPDYDVRERVFDALDLPDSLGAAGSPDAERRVREALAETAGVDLADEEPPDASREIEYRNEYTRSDLYNAAQDLGYDVDWSDATKTGLAELLAQENPGDVRDALPDE
jgi:hypothetical protein